MGIASLVNLVSAVSAGTEQAKYSCPCGPSDACWRCCVPSIVYVALIGGISLGPVEIPALGIYVASAIFIFAFMMAVGRENPIKAAGVAVAVPVALFFMFEKWFLVPLPKGPLEAWLGY